MDILSPSEQKFLKNYDASLYEKPSLCVDTILFTIRDMENKNYRKLPEKSLQILLTHRANYPYKDYFSLPGTFIKLDESLDECAARCLKEKTNLQDIYLEQLYTFGEVERDPRTRVISCTYMSLVNSDSLVASPGINVSSVEYFSIDTKISNIQVKETSQGNITTYDTLLTLTNKEHTLSAIVQTTKELVHTRSKLTYQVKESNQIAFDHAKAIVYALERLKNKIEYTDIAFSLMPTYFSLADLQRCYEIILGTSLITPNFRRKIAPMVIKTDKMVLGAGHRPSQLFQFNTNWHHHTFTDV